MKQLGNQDAGFVYNETPTTPMHISGLGIYDQSTAPGGRLGHKDIIKYVQDRIHIAPIFRYKFVEVPFGIDKPYWIEDPDFDIEFHLRHIALPQPGDWRQLCILISRLNSRPIDFSRPLWEAYIIEGLDNIPGLPKGSFAIMVKVHHSIVDGASGQAIFGALHDLSPDAIPSTPDKPLTVDRIPTTAELLGRALPNMISRPLNQTAALYKKAPNLISGALKLYQGSIESGTKLRVPQTRFNYSITPHRVFDGTHYELDDIKYIKNTIGEGTTVNDVMLDIVAGGMRKYLEHHHELPDDSLCAMLPQDIRTEATRNQVGNQVGGIFADLHTDIADPIDRLKSIHTSTNQAKRLAVEMDTASVVQNYMGGFFSPRMGRRFNRIMQDTKLLERFGPFAANTLVTNVPGPNFPLYHAGAQMVAYWGIPPLMDCLGLGHAIFSYCGKISLSAMACREMMPDPEFYIQCLNDAFEEIMEATKQIEKANAAAKVENDGQAAERPARKRAKRKRATAASRAAASTGATPQPSITEESAVEETTKADATSINATKEQTSISSDEGIEKKKPVRRRRRAASSFKAAPEAQAPVAGKADKPIKEKPTEATTAKESTEAANTEVKAESEKIKPAKKAKTKAKAKAKPASKPKAKSTAKTADKAKEKKKAKPAAKKTARKPAAKRVNTTLDIMDSLLADDDDAPAKPAPRKRAARKRSSSSSADVVPIESAKKDHDAA